MRANQEQFGYIQKRVARGEYRVNSSRVAAAMLQRIGAIVLERDINGQDDRARETAERDRPEV